jgi:hypothetical protein
MSAKEKAEELVDSYKFVLWSEDTEFGEEILCTGIAKRCALIAVDEIIYLLDRYIDPVRKYWEEVKQEINKL